MRLDFSTSAEKLVPITYNLVEINYSEILDYMCGPNLSVSPHYMTHAAEC